MTILLGAICALAALYQLIALFACLLFRSRKENFPAYQPGVSVLKPVCGADPEFYAAIRSHASLEYPEFELLFAVRDPNDPALSSIERLRAEFPRITLRIVRVTTLAPNAKVAGLIDAFKHARYPVIVVNDSDITVPPDYLTRVVAPLGHSFRTGLVTCLYRATGRSFAAQMEALGIATDFAPGALVAPLVRVNEFALGSTLAFRAVDLRTLGGFSTIADYLADDYQLGRLFSQAGYRIHLSRTVVETHLGGGEWADIWAHQLRWARTIRASQGLGYLGLPITNASLWAVLACVNGWWWVGLSLIGIRYCSAFAAASALQANFRLGALTPVRDLGGLAVWAAGLFGDSVKWRGARFRLTRTGGSTPLSRVRRASQLFPAGNCSANRIAFPIPHENGAALRLDGSAPVSHERGSEPKMHCQSESPFH
ncbi:MAG: bacteriohopanetetrol glucosamine biosynthesis glycosyltransferase HpnI [Bryobacteraceae bacterium]